MKDRKGIDKGRRDIGPIIHIEKMFDFTRRLEMHVLQSHLHLVVVVPRVEAFSFANAILVMDARLVSIVLLQRELVSWQRAIIRLLGSRASILSSRSAFLEGFILFLGFLKIQ